MLKETEKNTKKGGGLDKLGQLRKRAKAKFIGLPKVYGLIAVAKEEQEEFILANVDKDWVKSYSLTLTCASVIVQDGNTLKAKYCKQRWCNVCNRIRTAELINNYEPAFEQEKDLHFVTVTRKNVSEKDLKSEIDCLLKTCKKIQETARKKEMPIIGVRKLECTYNAKRKDFHPHIHLVIKGKKEAEYFRAEWLKKNGLNSDKKGQDVRPATEGSLKELFKYASKEVVKINGKKRINVYALHQINKAFAGLRIFQNIGGFNSNSKGETIDEEVDLKENEFNVESQSFEDLTPEKAVWEWSTNDWYNAETGEALTGYTPTSKDVRISNSIIYEHEKMYHLSG